MMTVVLSRMMAEASSTSSEIIYRINGVSVVVGVVVVVVVVVALSAIFILLTNNSSVL